jgi:hypothetical protein
MTVRPPAAAFLSLLVGCTIHVSGLLPQSPPPDSGRVDSARPTLRWEALSDAIPDPVSDVVYDLKVVAPDGSVFYDRNGLRENRHRLEVPLKSGVEYTWTVRARFRSAGQRRVTQWSTLSSGSGRDNGIPPPAEKYFPLKCVAADPKDGP